jgi:hypothetical protein
MESGKIIEQQKLANGIRLKLIDQYRVMIGDRWLVELRCEAHIPVGESFWDLVSDIDPQLLVEIKRILGDNVVFATIKQRNFIDTHERETVLREMVQQVYASMLDYMQRPDFPQEYFKKQYHETRKKLLLRQAMNRQEEGC